MEPCLWVNLFPDPEDLPFLAGIWDRFGASVRVLKLAGHGPNRLGSQALSFQQTAKCTSLDKLVLSGFRGRDLENFCQLRCPMPSLRTLIMECDPYFNLGSFSHNTGAHMASLPITWLVCFPNLEHLVCDYLRLEASDVEDTEACESTSSEEIIWSEREAPDLSSLSSPVLREETTEATPQRHSAPVLELPLAAISNPIRREEKRSEEIGPEPQLKKLRELSFVAIVRGNGCTWNSAHCRCDLSVLARLAPGLARLSVRSPNIALGRMSRRPGQRIEGLIKVSRHFCSTGLRDLLAVGYLLPVLRTLRVEVAKDDTSHSWDSSGSLLSLPTTSSKPLPFSHLALAMGVHDRPFCFSVGASDVLAAKLRRSTAAASAASVSAFHNFAVAEQHLALLQCMQKFQDEKERRVSHEFDLAIQEAA